MKRVNLFFCLLLQPLWLCAQTILPLVSPAEILKAEIRVSDKFVDIDLFDKGGKVVEAKTLQLELDKTILAGNWQVAGQTRTSIDQTWQPVYGERSLVTNRYNELELLIRSDENQKEMTLLVRLYDEGLAFRYAFDKVDFWNCTLVDEKTQFLFARDCDTWVTGGAQGAYSKTKLGALKGTADRPQVVQISDKQFVAIGEAALVDYSRMKLGKSEEGIGVQSVLSGKVNLDLAGYRSPWRYVMVADHPGMLVQNNYFVLNLNEPNQIENTSWIKPGQVIREVTLTTAGGLACVDFAAENGIEYVEFDAGWYGDEYNPESDASTITVDPKRSKGPLDLHKVIEYANQKGIGIILYVNMKALSKQLDQILPLYKQWGVKGLKYGFVDVGDQYSTAWLHQAIRKAAKYELMVDVHDEYRPTGYSRTYPNLITQEGIRGDEESPNLNQAIYTLYNRMICGAGDYTNCFFAERVMEKMGGRAAQLAKRIAIYSPWQFIFWYDRPYKAPSRDGGAGSTESVIKTDAITDFYCSIPVVWDDTRFYEGDMDSYAVVARRSASDWYVSILNAGDKRQVVLPLDMLKDQSRYKATLYYQAPGKKKEVVSVKEIKLQGQENLTLDVEGNSGCVLYLTQDWPQRSYQAGPVDMEVVQRGDSEFPVGFSAFSLEGHFVWCGSAIRAEEDGRYYLFYSAMESGTGHPPFVDAWLLGSKIGVAVSDSPYGGYKNIGFVYNKDGYTPDRSSWDAQTVSNTHIKRFNGKYYLYYCGSVDPGENARIKGTLSKRDRIQQNQKLGVLCFNSIKELLEGKYTCNEQPLLIPRSRVKPNNVLEPSPEGTAVKPDNLIMVNPAVVYCPANRKYFLYFKGNVYDPGWRGVHGVAISDEPAGPFRVLDDNVFEFETGTDQKLNAEDPYVWYHRKDRCFYAVFKDFTGGFTQGKPGLAIMYSKDGLHWELPEHSLFMNKEIILKNGEHVDVDRLERPQLFLDENDDPIVLYSACSITPLNQKKDGSSFNIQIPVLCSSGNPVTRFPR
ncbi:glycoside hydrolase family 97 catalytic domain-containing protein [Parabacteroides goldsteinii]|uniref:glycoside hydrolase family 97 catalytic domain-containing protein n=1 Tax=Parabacteroides goldsteinii TaxID=328812 RepID=UPI00256EC5D8|nr:glycoside hydrolase family 97 catalytic domain-containing protein [Parabacteroides goldsteinii]